MNDLYYTEEFIERKKNLTSLLIMAFIVETRERLGPSFEVYKSTHLLHILPSGQLTWVRR